VPIPGKRSKTETATLPRLYFLTSSMIEDEVSDNLKRKARTLLHVGEPFRPIDCDQTSPAWESKGADRPVNIEPSLQELYHIPSLGKGFNEVSN
jgi:hypothetical protein